MFFFKIKTSANPKYFERLIKRERCGGTGSVAQHGGSVGRI